MDPIIQLADLSREFVVRVKAGRLRRSTRIVRAVDEISAIVHPGESVGYIGANGAGKSTTIKMITGILVPSSGLVRTCGFDPVPERRRLAREIGVVFGQRSQLWWDLPLRDSFRILAAIHRLSAVTAERRTAELVERLDLSELLDTPVRQLSLGERMRGEVAAALVHSPRLLVLDEPTIGLDMISKERLRQFLIAERAAHNTTLLLTTHDMGDIERLCDRVLVVDHGRLAYDGTLTSLAERVALKRVLVVDLTEPRPPLQVASAEHVGSEGEGLRQRLAFAPELATAAQVLGEVSAQAEVVDLTLEEPAIEDIVRTLYERQDKNQGRPQNKRIGSITSARISTTPDTRITRPTAYAMGSILAVSTYPGSGRRNNRASARFAASYSAPAMCPPSSGSSGMKLNSATNRFTEPSTVKTVATLAAASIWSVEAISPAARLAPTMLIGP